jgi:hypothetical protein
MSAPRLPGYTCPLIDRVKSAILDAIAITKSDIETLEDFHTVMNEINSRLHNEDNILEDIRSANSQLRECAEYWQEDSEYWQKEVNMLKQQIEEMEEA